VQVNWRRGLFRVWLLLSAAWIMGYGVFLILNAMRGGFQSSGDLLSGLVLLIGPPIALLLFGLMAGWALRGFRPGA
jgi:hypothetical protein